MPHLSAARRLLAGVFVVFFVLSLYYGSTLAADHSGRLKWSFQTDDSLTYASPALSPNGTIYLTSNDHKLYAITPDGEKEWEFVTGGLIYPSPAVSPNGTIYVGSDDHKLYAITPGGQKEWEFDTGDSISSSPAISFNGTIYVGSDNDKLYAITPGGQEEWSFATGGNITFSPAIAPNGTIYVGSEDHNLYAVTPGGQEEWRFTAGDAIVSSPAIAANGTIYAGADDDKLYAISPNGQKEWEFTTGDWMTSSPVISANGTIYIGSCDDYLYAIDPGGVQEWRYKTGYMIESTPAIAEDGTIFFGSWDFHVYAITPSGETKWRYLTNLVVIGSPAIADDGTVYIGSTDGKLYALYGESGGLMDSRWPKDRQNNRNTGRYNKGVEPLPGQSVEITTPGTNSSACSESELEGRWGLDDYAPVTQKKAFRADIGTDGAVCAFRFGITGLSNRIDSLALLKLFEGNSTARGYGGYASSAGAVTDGSWWITDADNTYIGQDDTLDPVKNYYVVFCIKDNGPYDADRAYGSVLDPTVLARHDPDSSTGCVMSPRADFGMEWALIFPAFLIFWVRWAARRKD